MKKFICVFIALVCFCGGALAEEDRPSINLDGLHGSWVAAENVENVGELGFFLEPLNEYYENLSEEDFQRILDQAEGEIEKLENAPNITDYFGMVYVSSTGEMVSLLSLFNGVQPDIFEMEPLIASGYDTAYGDIIARMVFPTPYAPGEVVAVLVGIVEHEAEDGEIHVVWVAHRGEGVLIPEAGGAGGIQVTFRSELMEVVQNKDALIAIASLPKEAGQEE